MTALSDWHQCRSGISILGPSFWRTQEPIHRHLYRPPLLPLVINIEASPEPAVRRLANPPRSPSPDSLPPLEEATLPTQLLLDSDPLPPPPPLEPATPPPASPPPPPSPSPSTPAPSESSPGPGPSPSSPARVVVRSDSDWLEISLHDSVPETDPDTDTDEKQPQQSPPAAAARFQAADLAVVVHDSDSDADADADEDEKKQAQPAPAPAPAPGPVLPGGPDGFLPDLVERAISRLSDALLDHPTRLIARLQPSATQLTKAVEQLTQLQHHIAELTRLSATVLDTAVAEFHRAHRQQVASDEPAHGQPDTFSSAHTGKHGDTDTDGHDDSEEEEEHDEMVAQIESYSYRVGREWCNQKDGLWKAIVNLALDIWAKVPIKNNTQEQAFRGCRKKWKDISAQVKHTYNIFVSSADIKIWATEITSKVMEIAGGRENWQFDQAAVRNAIFAAHPAAAAEEKVRDMEREAGVRQRIDYDEMETMRRDMKAIALAVKRIQRINDALTPQKESRRKKMVKAFRGELINNKGELIRPLLSKRAVQQVQASVRKEKSLLLQPQQQQQPQQQPARSSSVPLRPPVAPLSLSASTDTTMTAEDDKADSDGEDDDDDDYTVTTDEDSEEQDDEHEQEDEADDGHYAYDQDEDAMDVTETVQAAATAAEEKQDNNSNLGSGAKEVTRTVADVGSALLKKRKNPAQRSVNRPAGRGATLVSPSSTTSNSSSSSSGGDSSGSGNGSTSPAGSGSSGEGDGDNVGNTRRPGRPKGSSDKAPRKRRRAVELRAAEAARDADEDGQADRALRELVAAEQERRDRPSLNQVAARSGSGGGGGAAQPRPKRVTRSLNNQPTVSLLGAEEAPQDAFAEIEERQLNPPKVSKRKKTAEARAQYNSRG